MPSPLSDRSKRQKRQVSTPGSMCAVCLHVMNLAPYREDEVVTVHLPNGKHTYRIKKRA